MKRILTITLCIALAFSCAGCGTKTAENDAPVTTVSDMTDKNNAVDSDTNPDKTADPVMPDPNAEEGNKPYPYHIAFANWTDDSRIYAGALNCKTMAISSVQHLPVYKFDTAVELETFRSTFADVLTMDRGLDEVSSFDDITAAYNDSFFSKYSLLLTYVPASSGSYRFGVNEVYCDNQSLCIYIEQLNHPEVYDCMMAGWFAVVEIDKEDLENCIDFDAQLRRVSSDGNIADTENIRSDVCALYLEVLEDLWNVDPGLNNGISQIGIDLSELSHLTEAEKETVMHEFAAKHNLPYIEGTWEELCEQGYIDQDKLFWENGLFFSIKTNEDAVWNLPFIKEGDPVPELTSFDAQKWRSGLGAYYFGQCTAQKNADGTWSYTVGQEAISDSSDFVKRYRVRRQVRLLGLSPQTDDMPVLL